MPKPTATSITLSQKQQEILLRIRRRRSCPQALAKRIEIVLKAAVGITNSAIAQTVGMTRKSVQVWRDRWQAASPRLDVIEQENGSQEVLEQAVEQVLQDHLRCGAPAKFSSEQAVQIVAIACEAVQESGRPVSHWTAREIADEAVVRGIVRSISVRQVRRFLKRSGSPTASMSLLAQRLSRRPCDFC